MKEHLQSIPTQDLLLELVRRSQHNCRDFEKIAKDLDQNRDLWVSCCSWLGMVVDRVSYWVAEERFEKGEEVSGLFSTLIPLRDLDQQMTEFHADEVLIVSSGKDDEKLLALAKTWETDRCEFLPRGVANPMLGGNIFDHQILWCWND